MQNFFAMVANGAIHTAAEDGKIAMIDVRDVAAVAAAALTEDGHEGKTYTITGPQAVTFDEAARELSAAAGGRSGTSASPGGGHARDDQGRRAGLVRERHGGPPSVVRGGPGRLSRPTTSRP